MEEHGIGTEVLVALAYAIAYQLATGFWKEVTWKPGKKDQPALGFPGSALVCH